jgi:hypothetical protein
MPKLKTYGHGQWRVQMAVGNAGRLAQFCRQGGRWKKKNSASLHVLKLNCRKGATLRMGKPRMEGPTIGRPRCQQFTASFLAQQKNPSLGDRALNEWIVEAPAGTVLNLTAHAARAGTVRASVTLK